MDVGEKMFFLCLLLCAVVIFWPEKTRPWWRKR